MKDRKKKGSARYLKKKLFRRRRLLFRIAVAVSAAAAVIIVTLSVSRNPAQASEEDFSCTKYYTTILVENGDTLWEIAENNLCGYYFSIYDYIDEVIQINSLKDDVITAGQYLIIPYYAG